MLGRALVSRAQRSTKVVRCRPGTVPVCGGPGSAVHRSTSYAAPRPGHAIASDAFVALFTFQTAHLVPAAHFCARGLQPCFAHPNRGVGGAPRDVRTPRLAPPSGSSLEDAPR